MRLTQKDELVRICIRNDDYVAAAEKLYEYENTDLPPEKIKEAIKNIESELRALKTERLLLCLDIILFIAIGVPMLCVPTGILSIDPSNQFVGIPLIVGPLLAGLGFMMQVNYTQNEKRIKGLGIIFVGGIIFFIGELLAVLLK